jgi:hypothetical protein
MQTAAILIKNIKMTQIADLAHDGKADTYGIAAGIPLFEPFK